MARQRLPTRHQHQQVETYERKTQKRHPDPPGKISSELLEFRGEQTLMIEVKDIQLACKLLRDEFGFQLLGSLTATDYWPESAPRFHLSYQLHNINEAISLRLRVPLNGSEPSVPTIEKIYPQC